MTLEEFEQSLAGAEPPAAATPPLQALWVEARGHWTNGDWDRAHRVVQDQSGADAAWVHAYLHRREGDLANAGYWYRRAGREAHQGGLDQEWAEIARALLAQGAG